MHGIILPISGQKNRRFAMSAIILFYKYVAIVEPGRIVKWQRDLCESLGLTGRIILATEGINGTLGGSDQAVEQYIDAMEQHALFGGIDFKKSAGTGNDFPRLRIVIKDEIVRMGVPAAELTVADGGKHLTPQETHELLTKRPENLVVLDTRND